MAFGWATATSLPPGARRAQTRLRHLMATPNLGEDDRPATPGAIAKAANMLGLFNRAGVDSPYIYLDGDGGLLLEWSFTDRDVTVEISDADTVLIVTPASGAEQESPDPSDDQLVASLAR